ncbi:MAG: heterodisulfide reductase-related iron-sulfur binding cluster [Leptospiraceae bacterium]|nr:heterodisulfide reductase-related iron-sulfur binding cluster [Leptospiraceae bacterium]MDW7976650.1 heterodisulfide reductase-related iron-sulfur binding cluster [Leptospiraceae bacterium]
MELISQTDTQDAIYDPKEPKYWDRASLNRELLRTFDICHGCRMCFNYCFSFPTLFKALDTYADGDVRKINQTDINEIIQNCYHCKLCYVNCPYTDRDKHAFNLNFAALMQRAVHIQAKEKGISFRDKFLQNADLAGKLNTGPISVLVNYVFQSEILRSVIEMLLGIHKKKIMPKFHKSSFAKWFEKHKKKRTHQKEQIKHKVVLFSTCFVNFNNPEIGKDAVFVLEKNQVHVEHPKQNCCGMPGLNSGDLSFALKKIKNNIQSLLPYVREGYKIAVINPTCSLTLKKEYIDYAGLLGKTKKEQEDWTNKAKEISEATMDIHEYLMTLKKEDAFNKDFQSTPESIAYHAPCHLRAQWKGYPSRDLMKLIPKTQIGFVAECSGHNGTWSMKKEFFEKSLHCGNKAFQQLKEKNMNVISTDCPLAAIQIKQGTNSKDIPLHPIQVLAKAYKKPEEGGFPKSTST